MPYYQIHHSYPLTTSQRQDLATSITQLHATTFNAPTLFVNVQFLPTSSLNEDYFYGGKRQTGTNRIFAYVRSGPTRTKQDFDKLAEELERLWDEAVGRAETDLGPGNEKVLQAVFIVPGIIAREEGFAICEAGQETAWIEGNMKDFERRAENGDQDMKDLIEEIGKRPELRGGRN